MNENKVSVKIYGQDYLVAGDKSRDHIIKVSDYVNQKMEEISAVSKVISLASLGVLAAVNIADDYFDALNVANELKSESVQKEKDIEHFAQLWEEAKKTIIGYKEDAKAIIDQKTALEEEVKVLKEEIKGFSKASEDIEAKAAMSSQTIITELEEKIRDLENNYFDIQMENIQLKSEMESKRGME